MTDSNHRRYPYPSLGIMRFDAYGMLWYGHYYTIYRRFVYKTLKRHIQEFLSIRYIQSIQWGQEKECFLEINMVSPKQCLCKMSRKDGGEVQQMNVATFLLNEPVLMSEVNENAGRQTILQNQFLKESKQSIVPLLKPMRSCQSTFDFFDEMLQVGQGGRLFLNTTIGFDLFEQVRTNALGGQKHLRLLYEKDNRMIVVARVENIKQEEVDLGLTNRTNILHSVCILNSCHLRSLFQLTQRVMTPNGKVLMEADLLMCCVGVKSKQLEPINEHMFSQMTRSFCVK